MILCNLQYTCTLLAYPLYCPFDHALGYWLTAPCIRPNVFSEKLTKSLTKRLVTESAYNKATDLANKCIKKDSVTGGYLRISWNFSEQLFFSAVVCDRLFLLLIHLRYAKKLFFASFVEKFGISVYGCVDYRIKHLKYGGTDLFLKTAQSQPQRHT